MGVGKFIWKATKIGAAGAAIIFGASLIIGDDVAVAVRTGAYGMSYGVGVGLGSVEEVGPGLVHGFNAADAATGGEPGGYLQKQAAAAEKAAEAAAKAEAEEAAKG